MGLLSFIVVILAISFLPLVARLKAAPPSIILGFLLGCIVGGLIVLYRRYKLQLHLQRLNLQAQEVNQSVYELHRPEGDPLMQVVFFHGLPLEDFSVAHLSSWESENRTCLWPKKWLVEEFPDAHILVVSYNKGLVKETVERLDMRIIGETLISDLIDASVGQRLDCPVVLVGHSFGGLVIKNLCVEGHHMLISKMNTDKVMKFLDNVKGILYYGTPHHGSPDISKAKHILGSPLFKYFTILSTERERLNFDFHNLPGKWQTKGLGEGLPVKLGMFRGVIVVPEAAAREGHSFSIDYQADHFSINKPDKKTSTRFTALTGLLHHIAHKLKEEIKSRDAKALEEARPQNFQSIPQHMHMTGLGFRLDEVKAKLKNCKTLGFVGMGGLGKTTLAKALFNELASTFEFTCFVNDVKLISCNEEQLKQAVWKYMHCDGKKAGETDQWFKLREKTVLVVLDDISSDRDVEVLLDIATDTSPESRFIVTSRDHVLLEGLDDKYEVPFLDDSDSKDLFRSHAFPNQLTPPPKFASDMEAIVKKCGGLPLTLEVLGRYLKTKDDNKYWKQTLEALDKAEEVTDLNKRLWAKLRPSYEDLGEKEQQMFLDAGTFFSNQSERWEMDKWTLGEALAAWSKAYETTSVLPLWQTLVDRSLVYNGKEDREIQMHEQLRTLARKIASESHNNDKCRVWENTEALTLLQSTHHTDNKEFHAFQLWRDWNQAKAIHIVGPALHKLKKVQFLELDDSVVIDGTVAVESFPSRLVLLRCAGLKIFNLDLQSQLVILKLRVGEHLLPSSIGRLSSLRVMVLSDAKLQENLPDEIGHLSKLEHLELKGWDRLQSLPETFGKLLNLKYLEFNKCAWLHALPECFGDLVSLEHLEFFGCLLLEGLPESFGNLFALKYLEFRSCEELKALPEFFGNLLALEHLEFIGCEQLKALPESFGNLLALEYLKFCNCTELKVLPESFGNLSTLKYLEFNSCEELKALPESFGNLSALKYLKFNSCEELKALPESFGNLSALKYLEFDSCEELIQALPESFGNLLALEFLEFNSCEELKALPESLGNLSALKSLKFDSCEQLKALPESFGNLLALEHLEFESCEQLKALPESFGNLLALEHLEFKKCGQLKALPESFGNLSALEHLNFQHCHALHALPESFGQLAKLQYLRISGMLSLNKLHKALAELMALNHLILECISVESIPNYIRSMSSLHTLELGRLPFINQLPTWFGNTGTTPLASSNKIFRKQDGHFTLAEEETTSWELENVLKLVTARALMRVRASDYEGALADCCLIDPELWAHSEAKGFLLQERGIAKRFVGDLQGALEDLTAALDFFFNSHKNAYAYDCWKHRGFVNFLLSDVEAAQRDGAMALKVLSKYTSKSWIRPCLGDELVMYMHFKLETASKMEEDKELMDSSHSQVMEKVRVSDPHAALALWEDFNARVSGYHNLAFFLQERGIIKHLLGDLQGALNDLTTALDICDYGSYDCFKNRAYVKYLMGDLDGARKDGLMALKVLSKVDVDHGKSSLADELVTFMHFRLKGRKEIEEERRGSPHFQVMKKVRELDFFGALAIWEAFDAKVSGYYDQLFFLQERGVLKRLVDDLHGALQDLNVALAMDPDDYECSKHRGYVKYLLGNIDGARVDAERCLAMGIKEASDSCLGTNSVTFLEFKL